MKNLILILLVAILTSCGSSDKYEYKYTITYTDATTEIVTTNTKLKFVGKADCVSTTGCGCSNKWCGVRKVEYISHTIVSGNQPVKLKKKRMTKQYIE